MGDAAITVGRQEEHLVFEGVGAQGPPMAEDYWLSGAPVVVEDLVSVLCRNESHGATPCCSDVAVDGPKFASALVHIRRELMILMASLDRERMESGRDRQYIKNDECLFCGDRTRLDGALIW
jgi:hypothetical protein